MPLVPSGPGQIRVTGQDDTVIFEGEGQVLLNAEDIRDGLWPGMSALRIREGNYHTQLDVTGLMGMGNVSVEVECEPVGFGPGDWAYLTDERVRVRTHVHFDIPASMALAMRRELYAGHPEYIRVREERRTLNGEQFRDDVRRICGAFDLDPAFVGVSEAALRAAQGLRECRETLRFEENEELMASTRAQFPYDPHDYGYPEGNEMRWTPPQEGEGVRSCPA